ncbi:MAG: aspartate carbamoyltransferase, partial [Clostridia bacterium]|nr:aspartate carbamoyltransferase [Clostridia bacterium]
MKNLIDILDLSTGEIEQLIDTANDIIENPDNYREKCRYKKLATLFFEPSTRTRLSFEAAMMELGG